MEILSITTLRGETLEIQAQHLHHHPTIASMEKEGETHHFNDPHQELCGIPYNKLKFLQALFERPQIILENPTYYLFRSNLMHSGLMYVGSTVYLPLGPWLESCLHTRELAFSVPIPAVDTIESQSPITKFYLLNAGGSPLTNTHTAEAFNPLDRRLVRFGTKKNLTPLPSSVVSWYKKFQTLNERFPWELRNPKPILQQMLLDLGFM